MEEKSGSTATAAESPATPTGAKLLLLPHAQRLHLRTCIMGQARSGLASFLYWWTADEDTRVIRFEVFWSVVGLSTPRISMHLWPSHPRRDARLFCVMMCDRCHPEADQIVVAALGVPPLLPQLARKAPWRDSVTHYFHAAICLYLRPLVRYIHNRHVDGI